MDINRLGSGAVLYRSSGCVTLHAVGLDESPHHKPHARGVAPVRRDPPETRRHEATNDENGRAPRIAAGEDPAATILSAYAVASICCLTAR
jgi:hypothetical protein